MKKKKPKSFFANKDSESDKVKSNITIFHKVTTRPNWEGIIFTGLDFSDQRVSISEAAPIRELKDHIEYIWSMEWTITESEGLPCILAPNPCAKLVIFRQNDKPTAPILFGANKEAKIFELHGSGASVGFDFKPGALFNFLGKSMTTFPEEGLPVGDLFKDFSYRAPNRDWDQDATWNRNYRGDYHYTNCYVASWPYP